MSSFLLFVFDGNTLSATISNIIAKVKSIESITIISPLCRAEGGRMKIIGRGLPYLEGFLPLTCSIGCHDMEIVNIVYTAFPCHKIPGLLLRIKLPRDVRLKIPDLLGPYPHENMEKFIEIFKIRVDFLGYYERRPWIIEIRERREGREVRRKLIEDKRTIVYIPFAIRLPPSGEAQSQASSACPLTLTMREHRLILYEEEGVERYVKIFKDLVLKLKQVDVARFKVIVMEREREDTYTEKEVPRENIEIDEKRIREAIKALTSKFRAFKGEES